MHIDTSIRSHLKDLLWQDLPEGYDYHDVRIIFPEFFHTFRLTDPPRLIHGDPHALKLSPSPAGTAFPFPGLSACQAGSTARHTSCPARISASSVPTEKSGVPINITRICLLPPFLPLHPAHKSHRGARPLSSLHRAARRDGRSSWQNALARSPSPSISKGSISWFRARTFTCSGRVTIPPFPGHAQASLLPGLLPGRLDDSPG